MRALREENARLESKLQREQQTKAVSAAGACVAAAPASAPQAPAPAPSVASAEPKATAEVPALTVGKLKPKKEAAPKLRTEVEVKEPSPNEVLEPSPEVLAAMKKIEAENRGEPAEPEEVDPVQGDQIYEKGLDALKTGNVSGGVAQLQQFATTAPQHAKADNALYFSGVGLMGLSSYEDASRAFEEVVSRYPAGDAVQDALLKLAECRIKLNKPEQARAVYQKIVSRFPGTAAASQAQGRLTQLR